MNARAVASLLGGLCLLFAAAQLVPAAVSFGTGEARTAQAFLVSALIAAVLAGLLRSVGRGSMHGPDGRPAFFRREGLATVGLGWIVASALGALPFVLAGAAAPVDAFFESTSGFTTTGATIFSASAVDGLAKGLSFWRGFSHWIGGIGIVLVFVALYPAGGRHLFRAEASREVDHARVRDSAGVLVGVYALFTAVHALLLRLAGMSTFDAIFHAFSSMSTGGFSNRGQSIAYYRSPLIEAICIVFMIVAGTNFAIWGAGWRRGPMEALRAFARSAEVHAYLLLLGGGSLVLTLVLWFWGGSNGQAGSDLPDYTGFLHCLRDATFNLVSIQTCTGYATADFDRWPDACRLLLMIGAFFGACAGSTGGGIKILRVVVVVRASLSAVRSFARPRVVEQLRIDGDRLEDERITSATRYFVLWILAALVGSLLLTLLGSDVTTALSSVVCCLNNVGPGLGSVGPATDYGFFDPASKLLLCALMILGRLEFYALVTLLLPGFWRR